MQNFYCQQSVIANSHFILNSCGNRQFTIIIIILYFIDKIISYFYSPIYRYIHIVFKYIYYYTSVICLLDISNKFISQMKIYIEKSNNAVSPHHRMNHNNTMTIILFIFFLLWLQCIIEYIYGILYAWRWADVSTLFQCDTRMWNLWS